MTQATPSAPRPRAKPDSLEKLNQQFAVFREGRPLAIGIHKAIAERLPDLNASQVRIALNMCLRIPLPRRTVGAANISARAQRQEGV